MAAMRKPIRWGILGTGLIAAEFAKAMQHVRDAELVSVGSRTQTSARSFANAHGLARAHGSYEALAEDPHVDVVYIATPHTLHHENTLLCLRAGKHVLCEKPFALNTAQLTEMVSAAQRHRLFLMEAMWMRFIPVLRDLQRRLANNEIGEVRMLQADFGFRAPFDPSSRLFNLDLAGGALLDIGIYPLAFAMLLLGEPAEIASVAHKAPTGVDEQSAYVLRHAQGQISVLASALRTQTSMSAYVYGTHGQIHLPKQFWRAKEMIVQPRNKAPQHVHLPYEGNGYQFEAQEVVDCLLAGKTESEIMPLADSLSLMLTMDQIRRQWGLKYPVEKFGDLNP